MDLNKAIRSIIERAKDLKVMKATEAQTKNSLILPLLEELGYDHYNHNEVCAEYTADFGIKKGEKVDYAIIINGKPRIIMECKPVTTTLADGKHGSQLYRYFAASVDKKAERKIAILTNGLVYKFFADFKIPNVMDSEPFFVINLETAKTDEINTLKQFSKSELDVDKFLLKAKSMFILQNIVSQLTKDMNDPEEYFIRYVIKKLDGTATKTAIAEYKLLIRNAFDKIIDDRIKLRYELGKEKEETIKKPLSEGVVTTDDEWEGYYIVRAICSKLVPTSSVIMRDRETYCGILFDKDTQPIMRLWFNNPNKKFVGWFDEERKERKEPIEKVSDIIKFKDQIRATVQRYIDKPSKNKE